MLDALESLGSSAVAEVEATITSTCDVEAPLRDEYILVEFSLVWTPMGEGVLPENEFALVNTRSMQKNPATPSGGRYFTSVSSVANSESSPSVTCDGVDAADGDLAATLQYSLGFVEDHDVSEDDARLQIEDGYIERGSPSLTGKSLVFDFE
jgi:hypothetical protein